MLDSPLNLFRFALKTGIGGAISEVASVVLRLGVKFLPIVGWVALAIDALNLFKAHATDIGWVLGSIVRWLRTSLWPGIVANVQWGFAQIGNTIMSMLRGIINMVTNPGAMMGNLRGGVAQWFADIQNGVANSVQAFGEANKGDIRKSDGHGGYRVVNPADARRAVPIPGRNAPAGSTVVHMENNFVTHGATDAKAVGREVVKHLTFASDRAARTMGGNTGTVFAQGSSLQGVR